MNIKRIVPWLLGGVLMLPMTVLLALGAAAILAAMGDDGGALGLRRTAVVLGMGWGCSLVSLLVTLGFLMSHSRALEMTPEMDESREVDSLE